MRYLWLILLVPCSVLAVAMFAVSMAQMFKDMDTPYASNAPEALIAGFGIVIEAVLGMLPLVVMVVCWLLVLGY